MEDLTQFITKCDPKCSRKRKCDRTTWKRSMEQRKRYESKGFPKFPKCNHNQKAFRCAQVTRQNIRRFHMHFYECKTKISQDNFILKYCNVKTADTKKTISKRKIATKYHIIGNHGKMVPVCQKTFLDALLIKKDRVKGIMKDFIKVEGVIQKKKEGVIDEPKSIRQEESQCNNSLNNLNVKKVTIAVQKRKDYTSQPNLTSENYGECTIQNVKMTLKSNSFFRHIFDTYYNIGFGSPRTDVCSTCTSLQEQMKIETDPTKRVELMTNKRIHRLKYKAFYQILQEEAETIKTITFDCQKNQPLPKLPDQSAYFSRQFNFIHFAIVDGNSKAKLTKNNVHSYYWSEVTHNKGGNEIVSAVYHYLQQVTFNEQTKILRVVCDGCSGQNKNTNMVAMLGKWLYSEAPRHVKKIEIIYPIVGHSFIPPDRVFAKIEKSLKTKEVITSPEEYVSVLEENGTVTDLSKIPVYNWKNSYEAIIKPTTAWHFQLMKSKRFFLTRSKTNNVLVQGEVNYRSEMNFKKVITKKDKKITMLSPKTIQANTILPHKVKVDDVIKLLEKHFGTDWRNLPTLDFYKKIEERLQAHNSEGFDRNPESDVNILCEQGFQDVETHV